MRVKVLGFRFCTVSPEASNLAAFFDAIGFERHPLEFGSDPEDDSFAGAVFAAGDSWLAMWPPGADMPLGMMLQVVVDDADAFAARAREQGLNPAGPSDTQGKRIYFLQAPTGLQISIQSRLVAQAQSLPSPPPLPARPQNPTASGAQAPAHSAPQRTQPPTTQPQRTQPPNAQPQPAQPANAQPQRTQSPAAARPRVQRVTAPPAPGGKPPPPPRLPKGVTPQFGASFPVQASKIPPPPPGVGAFRRPR